MYILTIQSDGCEDFTFNEILTSRTLNRARISQKQYSVCQNIVRACYQYVSFFYSTESQVERNVYSNISRLDHAESTLFAMTAIAIQRNGITASSALQKIVSDCWKKNKKTRHQSNSHWDMGQHTSSCCKHAANAAPCVYVTAGFQTFDQFVKRPTGFLAGRPDLKQVQFTKVKKWVNKPVCALCSQKAGPCMRWTVLSPGHWSFTYAYKRYWKEAAKYNLGTRLTSYFSC